MVDGAMSFVDDLIARHKAKTIGVRTGSDGSDAPKEPFKYRKLDDSGEGESPLGWEDFIADSVFENIPKMVEDDVELCKTVNSYVNSIRYDKGIASDAKLNGRSLLWFELLRTVGWLDDFLSSKDVVAEVLKKDSPLKKDEPLKHGEFTRLTAKWASDTGIDWRTWFHLLCFLRSAKLTMITNASTKTLEALDNEVYGYRVIHAVANISSKYSRSKIQTLRVDKGAPFSESKVTNEQWSRIQRMVLTMYNVLPNDRNIETLNSGRDTVVVNGLSLDALRDYLASFYYHILSLYSRELSLNDYMMPAGDRVFIDHMLSKDLRNYEYISPYHSTQADADLASSDYSASNLVPSKFRMSETFIVNAFKHDKVRLLEPGGVSQLADFGLDSDELFNRLLEVVGTEGRADLPEHIRGDWKTWLQGHVEKLDKKEFNEIKKVVDSNPNTIIFFPPYKLAYVEADDDVIGMLENVITTKNVIADTAIKSALEILEYFYHDDQTITRDQYIGLLYKGIELKHNEVLEYVVDDKGMASPGVLKAIDGDTPLLKNVMTAIITSFQIEDTILPMLTAASLEDDAWITKEVVQELLKETKVLTAAYGDPEQYHEFEYALKAQRGGFIEREELIELVAMALRTAPTLYDYEFNKLAFDDNEFTTPEFTAQELAVLFAAQRRYEVTFEDSTFKVLYLAMSKAPEDTAFLIKNFLVVKTESETQRSLYQMVVSPSDYDLLNKLYFELTGKTLIA